MSLGRTTDGDVERALHHALVEMAAGELLHEEERWVDAHVLTFTEAKRENYGLILRLKGGEEFTVHIRRRNP